MSKVSILNQLALAEKELQILRIEKRELLKRFSTFLYEHNYCDADIWAEGDAIGDFFFRTDGD